jgi:hypothetical protein
MSDQKITRGDSPSLDGALTNPLSNPPNLPLPLDGATVWFTVRDGYGGDVVFQKKTGGGGIIVQVPADQGRLSINLATGDTSSLENVLHEFVYDLQVKLASGAVLTPMKGRFLVEPEVTVGEP